MTSSIWSKSPTWIKSIALLLALWMAAGWWEWTRRQYRAWRGASRILAQRRRAGIPDSDTRPFRIAKAAVDQARHTSSSSSPSRRAGNDNRMVSMSSRSRVGSYSAYGAPATAAYQRRPDSALLRQATASASSSRVPSSVMPHYATPSLASHSHFRPKSASRVSSLSRYATVNRALARSRSSSIAGANAPEARVSSRGDGAEATRGPTGRVATWRRGVSGEHPANAHEPSGSSGRGLKRSATSYPESLLSVAGAAPSDQYLAPIMPASSSRSLVANTMKRTNKKFRPNLGVGADQHRRFPLSTSRLPSVGSTSQPHSKSKLPGQFQDASSGESEPEDGMELDHAVEDTAPQRDEDGMDIEESSASGLKPDHAVKRKMDIVDADAATERHDVEDRNGTSSQFPTEGSRQRKERRKAVNGVDSPRHTVNDPCPLHASNGSLSSMTPHLPHELDGLASSSSSRRQVGGLPASTTPSKTKPRNSFGTLAREKTKEQRQQQRQQQAQGEELQRQGLFINAAGEKFKWTDDGVKLKLVGVLRRQKRYSMPQDSEHPDACTEENVYVDEWVTEEEFGRLRRAGKLRGQAEQTPPLPDENDDPDASLQVDSDSPSWSNSRSNSSRPPTGSGTRWLTGGGSAAGASGTVSAAMGSPLRSPRTQPRNSLGKIRISGTPVKKPSSMLAATVASSSGLGLGLSNSAIGGRVSSSSTSASSSTHGQGQGHGHGHARRTSGVLKKGKSGRWLVEESSPEPEPHIVDDVDPVSLGPIVDASTPSSTMRSTPVPVMPPTGEVKFGFDRAKSESASVMGLDTPPATAMGSSSIKGTPPSHSMTESSPFSFGASNPSSTSTSLPASTSTSSNPLGQSAPVSSVPSIFSFGASTGTRPDALSAKPAFAFGSSPSTMTTSTGSAPAFSFGVPTSSGNSSASAPSQLNAPSCPAPAPSSTIPVMASNFKFGAHDENNDSVMMHGSPGPLAFDTDASKSNSLGSTPALPSSGTFGSTPTPSASVRFGGSSSPLTTTTWPAATTATAVSSSAAPASSFGEAGLGTTKASSKSTPFSFSNLNGSTTTPTTDVKPPSDSVSQSTTTTSATSPGDTGAKLDTTSTFRFGGSSSLQSGTPLQSNWGTSTKPESIEGHKPIVTPSIFGVSSSTTIANKDTGASSQGQVESSFKPAAFTFGTTTSNQGLDSKTRASSSESSVFTSTPTITNTTTGTTGRMASGLAAFSGSKFSFGTANATTSPFSVPNQVTPTATSLGRESKTGLSAQASPFTPSSSVFGAGSNTVSSSSALSASARQTSTDKPFVFGSSSESTAPSSPSGVKSGGGGGGGTSSTLSGNGDGDVSGETSRRKIAGPGRRVLDRAMAGVVKDVKDTTTTSTPTASTTAPISAAMTSTATRSTSSFVPHVTFSFAPSTPTATKSTTSTTAVPGFGVVNGDANGPFGVFKFGSTPSSSSFGNSTTSGDTMTPFGGIVVPPWSSSPRDGQGKGPGGAAVTSSSSSPSMMRMGSGPGSGPGAGSDDDDALGPTITVTSPSPQPSPQPSG